MKYELYCIFDKLNGILGYIGQTTTSHKKRKSVTVALSKNKKLRYYDSPLSQAIRDIGVENCEWNKLFDVETNNPRDIDQLEELLIEKLHPAWNIQSGGRANFKQDEEGNIRRSRKSEGFSVQDLETGTIYETLRACERELGVIHSRIKHICNGDMKSKYKLVRVEK